MTETIKAWHFVGDRLRDGRPIPKDGVWLRHEGPIKICASGLHASRRPWDALRYAPGATLCYVECRGDIHEHDDKLVCRERRIIMRADVTETLRYFARMQALSAVHLWASELPDVVLDYLMTGDEKIRRAAWAAAQTASWDAAQTAAWAAARGALRGALRGAAWDAARDAARDAAWAAAWDAARDAARDAAWAAARDAAWAAAWDAARDAARDAAWAAARDAARAAAARAAAGQEFDELVCEQFGVEA